MITGHGNDRYLFDIEIKGDFSSNIAFNNHGDIILRHLKENLDGILNYPDPKSEKLTTLIASHHGISPKQVLVTAGSAEAFYIIAHRYAGARSLIAIPSFAEYEDSCLLFEHELSYAGLSKLWSTDVRSMDTVWWGSPNNPDGVISTPDQVRQLVQSAPKTTFVVDCAYTHLSEHTQDLTPLHDEFSNLITVHSLTKAFDIPGLRLGYIIASRDIIDELRGFQIPWSVNAIAQEAGHFVMNHYDELLPDIPALIRASHLFQQEVASVEQLEVTPSATNYFLVRMKEGTAVDLKHHLIHEHGLLIRDASNFRSLTPQHFRLAVQAPEENKLLISALKQYFNAK